MKTERRHDPRPLPSRFEGYEIRLPQSLDDLKGPAEGVLELPLRIGRWELADWSRWPCVRDLVCDG